MNMDSYVRRLVTRFDNPPRPQFISVVEATKGIHDPQEAWRHLLQLNLIPNAFEMDLRRRYAESSGGRPVFPDERPPEHQQPSSIEAVLTVGSDPIGFLEAEGYAREFARRVEPWTAVCNGEVVWYFTENPYKQHPFETAYLGLSFNSAVDTVDLTLDMAANRPESVKAHEELEKLPVLVRRTVAAWQGWEFSTSHDLPIREPRWPLDLSLWHSFSQLKNPFEPLLELWCTGYRIVCDFDVKDPVIRLYAKPVPRAVT